MVRGVRGGGVGPGGAKRSRAFLIREYKIQAGGGVISPIGGRGIKTPTTRDGHPRLRLWRRSAVLWLSHLRDGTAMLADHYGCETRKGVRYGCCCKFAENGNQS